MPRHSPEVPQSGSETAIRENYDTKLRERFPIVFVPGYWETLEGEVLRWSREVSDSDFWRMVRDDVFGWAREFEHQTSGKLLVAGRLQDFQGKGLPRLESKCRIRSVDRHGIVRIDPIWPADQYPIPKLDDLVRTRVTCRYLDGVDYLADRLARAANSMGIRNQSRRTATRGYFAHHFYFERKATFRFEKLEFETPIKCEVQISTELANVIWDETHPFYEQSRDALDRADESEWSPEDPIFVARRLGHLIHLVDGLLQNLRNAARTKRIPNE